MAESREKPPIFLQFASSPEALLPTHDSDRPTSESTDVFPDHWPRLCPEYVQEHRCWPAQKTSAQANHEMLQASGCDRERPPAPERCALWHRQCVQPLAGRVLTRAGTTQR